MAIYANDIPYLVTQIKRVALPKSKEVGAKIGYDNLAFLFSDSIPHSIHMMNNIENMYNDNKYKRYYYNLQYRGRIGSHPYNIKNFDERKDIYKRITTSTKLTPHPPSMLNTTPNKNTFFEMSKYYEIYKYMTAKFSLQRKMNVFWEYFKSIWFSPQTDGFRNKFVMIDADIFDNFKGNIKECIDNPLFMLYFTMYKHPEYLSSVNIDFYIYCKRTILRVNPSKCDKKTFSQFKRELNKLYNRVTGLAELDEEELDKEVQKENIKESLMNKYNFTGDNDSKEEVTSLDKKDDKVEKKSEIHEELQKTIDDKVDENLSKASETLSGTDVDSKDVESFVKTQAEIDIESDDKLIENMYRAMQNQKVPTKPVSSARDLALRNKQESLKVKNLTFSQLESVHPGKREIPKRDISNNMKSINPNMKTMQYSNMNKDYIQNIYSSDIAKVFKSLNDKSSKVFVKDISVTDSSNELNYKETWTVILEDENKMKHTITVDMPKFIDNKFMYLGGNKKIINKQNFFYPVVKTAPDTVQMVSNYNKMFITRIGTKSISSVERIMKLISNNEDCYKYFSVGNCSTENSTYLTTIEYDEFAKTLKSFKTPNCEILFSQTEAIKYADFHAIDIPEGKIFIGMKDKLPIFIDPDKQTTDNGQSICDLIVTELPDELRLAFNKTNVNKKLMYNSVTVMAQHIPFVVLLVLWEGISKVITKMGIKYRFSAHRPDIESNENYIRFRDGYLIYEDSVSIGLLMNGLSYLDTEGHDFDEYNSVEPLTDYLKKVYGKLSIISALQNSYDFFIDPITKEVCEDVNLPTDLVELCIYASNLLSDENYTPENSQNIARVRSTEIIPAMLYYQISQAYINYKNSAGKKRMSVQKDCVIKELLALQTVEDYSTLNPVVELEKDRTITSKGYVGVNVERAYTEEKRSYDKSMIGVVAMSTSPDGNCGITRFLSMEPKITSARGYVENNENHKEKLKDVNIFSPAELLYPLGNTRDDSIRTAMAGKQSKHVIPIQNASPALISNGSDEYIKYELSSDFVVIAEEDGTVIDYDEKNKILMVEYKSGKHRAVNLSPNIVKNGGGGFYLNNLLQSKYKVGDKFKKDDTLAYHKDFFKDDKFNGVRMNVGVLSKVAIISSYNTYNDSTVITTKLANESKASMTFCKATVLGKNSNVYNIKKVGDHVSIGESLLDFDTSFEDSDLNKLLSHLSDDNKSILEESSMTSIKSKYAGKIVDIKIYATIDLADMSPSLASVVKAYYKKVNDKKEFINKYSNATDSGIVKCGMLLNETSGKITPNIYGVIKGEKVEDSVLIEFYIEHDDVMGVGDKLAYFTALKSIIGEVIPEGYEPYSEFRPNEEVSSLIGPSAILKRQVPSILITVLGNKVIVELKRKLMEIYNS